MIWQWLQEERLPNWVRAIADYAAYSEEEEKEIEAICEAEMSDWRAYCKEMPSGTFEEMMIHTRTFLRVNFLLPGDEWWNPDMEEWEHIGLKYLTCTEAQWDHLKEQWLKRRLLLHDPQTLLSRAKGMLYSGLMDAASWPEMVVALALMTGRSLLQIVKNGTCSQHTSYSLLFRDEEHFNLFFPKPFEVPTLGRADLVVEAWERVREVLDCSHLKEEEICQMYEQIVEETAESYFLDLVPRRSHETSLFDLLRWSVYPCLATHYYCPPDDDEVAYIASITGNHTSRFLTSPGERFADAAVIRDAYAYAIVDERGQIDERKGIWFEKVGLKVIQVTFEEHEVRELEAVRQAMGFGEDPRHKDADGGIGRKPKEPLSLSGTVQLDIRVQKEGISPQLHAFIQAGLEYLSEDVFEFFHVCLHEDMLHGLKLQRPFKDMTSSELRTCTHSQAVDELVRRTLLTLMQYNQRLSDPTKRLFLCEDIIVQVTQAKRDSVRWSLQFYEQEITAHHERFAISDVQTEHHGGIPEGISLHESPQYFRENMNGFC